MSEYNFRVTTIETGWVEIHAGSEKEAKFRLKETYLDRTELLDAMKWKEGCIDKIELQKEGRDEDVTYLY
jgi:hypothetical protein